MLRDRDTNGDPSTLEERRYYCQNFRGDVSAIITDTGKMVEWVKYSAYGTPFALPAYDVNSDGDFDTTDVTTDPTGYDVRWDFDLDGDSDIDDVVDALDLHGGTITLGRGKLSASHTKSRKAYAGYERDATFEGAGRNIHHVRYRVYDADTGRWNRRDPQGYIDGMSLYAYVQGLAVVAADPWGLMTCAGGGCGIPMAPPSRGGGIGPGVCAGGTCGIPKVPGPGRSGGYGPIICASASCTVQGPPTSPIDGYLKDCQDGVDQLKDPGKKTKEDKEKAKYLPKPKFDLNSYGSHMRLRVRCGRYTIAQEYRGTVRTNRSVLAALKANGCCIEYLSIDAHHSMSGEWFTRDGGADNVWDPEMLEAVPPLCDGALVDLNACNMEDFKNKLRWRNPGARFQICWVKYSCWNVPSYDFDPTPPTEGRHCESFVPAPPMEIMVPGPGGLWPVPVVNPPWR